MSDTPTPETDAACPYCKAMPMGMIVKVRWTCGSYGGPTGRSEQCKERANAWEQRDEALQERNEAREALRKAIRFVEAYEPHSRGVEEDQNETLSIIRKVLEGVK